MNFFLLFLIFGSIFIHKPVSVLLYYSLLYHLLSHTLHSLLLLTIYLLLCPFLRFPSPLSAFHSPPFCSSSTSPQSNFFFFNTFTSYQSPYPHVQSSPIILSHFPVHSFLPSLNPHVLFFQQLSHILSKHCFSSTFSYFLFSLSCLYSLVLQSSLNFASTVSHLPSRVLLTLCLPLSCGTLNPLSSLPRSLPGHLIVLNRL